MQVKHAESFAPIQDDNHFPTNNKIWNLSPVGVGNIANFTESCNKWSELSVSCNQLEKSCLDPPSWCQWWPTQSWGTWSSRPAWPLGGRWCWRSSAAPRRAPSGKQASRHPPLSPRVNAPYCTSARGRATSAHTTTRQVKQQRWVADSS